MKKLLILLCISPLIGIGQHHCGTAKLMQNAAPADYYKQLYKVIGKYSAGTKAPATVNIPVVFHIVYNTPQQNIDDSLVHQQMVTLNEDFNRWNADTVNTPGAFKPLAGSMDINFCLAQQTPNGQPTNGILRVSTQKTSFASPLTYAVPDPVKHDSLDGSDAWDTQTYLNIWVCNLTGSTAYSAPPGNFLPNDEGIVCKYQHVGNAGATSYPYHKGRSIVHEAGHYFGLKHTWGDDNGACTGTDWINDTPNQANFSTNCSTFPKTDACSPSSPGVMYMNYMDYSEDGCRNMFTKDQVNAMSNCITNFRSGFLTATGCNTPTTVHEPGQLDLVNVYATSDLLVIEGAAGNNAIVEVMDVLGRMLTQFEHSGMKTQHPLNAINTGVHFVRVTNKDSQRKTAKIFIQR